MESLLPGPRVPAVSVLLCVLIAALKTFLLSR